MRRLKKMVGRIVPLVLCLTLILSATTFDTAEAVSTHTRIAGSNRYQTAMLVADNLKRNFGVTKFDTIIVASGENYADALAGSYLANVKKAPILVVNKYNEKLVQDYIKKNLKSGGKVYLLGGTGAVSENFELALNSFCNVERLGGADRFETNIKILNEAGIGNKELMLCSAWDFADSLSASAVGKPILLVSNRLKDNQKNVIKTATSKTSYMIGGTGAVSTAVENEVKSLGKTTKRVAGKDRFSTSVAVAETFFGYNAPTAVVAYGNDFPDGLVGGPLGASMKAPLILVNNKNIYAAGTYFYSAGTEHLVVLGGPALISENTIEAFKPVYIQVLELVNKERKAAGVKPLAIDPTLNVVAQIKAEDMAKLGYWGHTSPTFGDPFEMMEYFGIDYFTAGENIAKGQPTPQWVMQSWMNSPGHRSNILDVDFTHIGIGYALDAHGTPCWVQMFIG